MLCHRNGGRPENIGGRGSNKNHLMEQVLLLNVPKICGGIELSPLSPFFRRPCMVFIEAGNADDAEFEKGGEIIARNNMISLIDIKIRTYLIDLKFRIKQMEVLYF